MQSSAVSTPVAAPAVAHGVRFASDTRFTAFAVACHICFASDNRNCNSQCSLTRFRTDSSNKHYDIPKPAIARVAAPAVARVVRFASDTRIAAPAVACHICFASDNRNCNSQCSRTRFRTNV